MQKSKYGLDQFYTKVNVAEKCLSTLSLNEYDIIKYGISLKDASDIITNDLNNTDIIVGHNIKRFDLRCINKLNSKFNNIELGSRNASIKQILKKLRKYRNLKLIKILNICLTKNGTKL